MRVVALEKIGERVGSTKKACVNQEPKSYKNIFIATKLAVGMLGFVGAQLIRYSIEDKRKNN